MLNIFNNYKIRLQLIMGILIILSLTMIYVLNVFNSDLNLFFKEIEIQKNKVSNYTLNQMIRLNSHKADKYLKKGWSIPEKNHRWTDGRDAVILLKNNQFKNQNLLFKIKMSGFLYKNHPFQHVNIYVNEHYLQTWQVSNLAWFSLEIPSILIQKNILSIRFEISSAASPKSLNLSQDTRVLGLFTKQFVIQKINKSIS